MRVVHEPADGDARTLATRADVAESFGAKLRGLMFRSSIPDDYALVFEFDGPTRRSVHMLFVPFPIDVVWTIEDEVTHTKTLPAWYGLGWAQGDRFLELAAGAADGVSPGDEVRLQEAEDAR